VPNSDDEIDVNGKLIDGSKNLDLDESASTGLSVIASTWPNVSGTESTATSQVIALTKILARRKRI
jgi:hypothetical protein